MPNSLGVDFDLAQVRRADGVVRDGHLIALAGAIVGDGERFAGRGGALLLSGGRCGECGIH